MNKNTMRTLSALFRRFMGMLFFLPNIIGKKNNMEDFATNVMIPISEAMERNSNCYVTYNLYPKKALDQNDWLYGKGNYYDKVSIVIQGPVIKENDYTLETVRLYEKLYPGVLVIVSTWKNEDDIYLTRLSEEKNCIVLKNDEPPISGACNINYQMISSLGGVKKAKELGKEYVLKTRSDTRITETGILELLVEMCKIYPSGSEYQNSRIILFNAYLLLPYQEFGSYYFGTADDLIAFFSAKYNPGNNERKSYLEKDYTYRQMLDMGTALNWLVQCYVSKLKKKKIDCDLNDWWSDIADLFICLPVTMLRPLWVKYDYNHEESDMTWSYRRKMMGSTGVDNTMIDFAMWRSLCSGEMPDASIYEYLLDEPLR